MPHRSHLAFVTLPVQAHVAPTLAVVAELVRRGHRVTYATTTRFAATAAASGADIVLIDSMLAPAGPLPEMPVEGRSAAPPALLMASLRLAPRLVAHFAGDRPDVILHDATTYPVAGLLSRLWDRPEVELVPTFATNGHYRGLRWDGAASGRALDPAAARFRAEMATVLAHHHLGHLPAPDVTDLEGRTLRLVFVTRQFQYAGDTFDDRFVFVGPCLSQRGLQGDWTPPDDDLPLVHVRLGGPPDVSPGFVEDCLEAFAGEPVHVVICAATGLTTPARRALPPNVEARPDVPRLAVLQYAAAFVHHAAMDATMEALYFGTPVVVLPRTAGEAAVARRITELGLGRSLAPGELSPRSLCEAVRDVTTDEGLHDRTRVARRAVHAAGGASRAADALESFAAVTGAR